MNEEMKAAWLEISRMLGEPTREELDVFLRTWQRASQATRKALAEQSAQRTWQGLTDEEIEQGCKESWVTEQAWQSAVWWAEAKLKEKNT
jgi:hypothetical protein